MPIQPGTHRFGPENATLRVRTSRRGAAAKAGHDLVIEVTSWHATLEVPEDMRQVRLELEADGDSLRVREGTGGIQPLKEDDKDEIRRTIDEQVLNARRIEFRSTSAEAAEGGRRLRVRGDLEIVGRTHPVEFELMLGPDDRITGTTTIKQTDWGIEPYSGLFGALKLVDEVEVDVEADHAPR